MYFLGSSDWVYMPTSRRHKAGLVVLALEPSEWLNQCWWIPFHPTHQVALAGRASRYMTPKVSACTLSTLPFLGLTQSEATRLDPPRVTVRVSSPSILSESITLFSPFEPPTTETLEYYEGGGQENIQQQSSSSRLVCHWCFVLLDYSVPSLLGHTRWMRGASWYESLSCFINTIH